MEKPKKFTVRFLDWLGPKLVSEMTDEDKEFHKDIMWEVEPSTEPLGPIRIREYFLKNEEKVKVK